jgi:hypothetical protein
MMDNIPATMGEQIEEAESLEISYRVLHPAAYLHDKESDTTIRVPFSSIINKYKDYLSNIIIEKELSAADQKKYQYSPKALSDKIYGTTELWDTLLVLNGCESIIDFKPTDFVKIYDPARLKSYLNEVMIIEERLGNISY